METEHTHFSISLQVARIDGTVEICPCLKVTQRSFGSQNSYTDITFYRLSMPIECAESFSRSRSNGSLFSPKRVTDTVCNTHTHIHTHIHTQLSSIYLVSTSTVSSIAQVLLLTCIKWSILTCDAVSKQLLSRYLLLLSVWEQELLVSHSDS